MPEEVCTRQAGGAAAMVARGEGQRPGKRAKPNKEERAASTDADLKSLVLNANGAAVTFYPSFSASTLAYNANIVQGETTATVAVSAYRHPKPYS